MGGTPPSEPRKGGVLSPLRAKHAWSIRDEQFRDMWPAMCAQQSLATCRGDATYRLKTRVVDIDGASTFWDFTSSVIARREATGC
jgi:hypothetical protein